MADPAPSAATVDGLYDVIFDLLRPGDRSGIPTAVDHAYEMIWRQLIGRERQPGERLTDTELAAQLGLSRTPVRQALHLLAREELVRFDARRGFSVKVITARDVREIYDVRSALEGLAVRLAAPRLTAGQLEVRLGSLHEVRGAIRNAPDQQRANVLHLKEDLELHNLLIQASGNGRLIRILGALRSQQSLFQYWDTSYPQRNEAATDEHERILLALIAGHTEEAAESMAQHITNARDRVLADLFGATEAPGRNRRED
ncbi:MAG: GntR family transcriptional regulator [Chloroflexi bacterium]|nr:GntR family transcriptional regulator [Chloroflexota bacterium]